ncbi:MAG: substrate-binding domain-containing protein, partial [Tepidisphaeraceae bacterium]
MTRINGGSRLAATAVAVVLGFAGWGCERSDQGAGSTTSPSGGPTIAVIPKGTTHVFWKSVEEGARRAAAEAGVSIVWRGPLKENDRAQQIQIVDQFVAEGVDGIVLAPLDDTALQRPVAGAMAKGIPVVIIDSGLKGESGKDFVSFVATNNHQGGILAGEALAKLLNGKGKVVLIRYLEGSASTTEREEGFLEVMKRSAGIEVTVSNRFGGPNIEDAQKLGMSMLDALKEADGLFCSNEPTAFGMLLALRQQNLAGRIKFVGFDATEPMVEALRKGEMQAIVTQNPVKIGYEGVRTMRRVSRAEGSRSSRIAFEPEIPQVAKGSHRDDVQRAAYDVRDRAPRGVGRELRRHPAQSRRFAFVADVELVDDRDHARRALHGREQRVHVVGRAAAAQRRAAVGDEDVDDGLLAEVADARADALGDLVVARVVALEHAARLVRHPARAVAQVLPGPAEEVARLVDAARRLVAQHRAAARAVGGVEQVHDPHTRRQAGGGGDRCAGAGEVTLLFLVTEPMRRRPMRRRHRVARALVQV